MVSKVSPHVSVVTLDSTQTTHRPVTDNIDEEFFEIEESKSDYTDTYKSSSSKSLNGADDGKISAGEFCSEYFSGSWDELKRQGNELWNTAKKHPVLSTLVVGGTIAAAAFFPAFAIGLGVLSSALGGYELVKDAINGKKVYDKYKNAKTDDEAKQYARDMGAKSLNCVEDAGMMCLGGRAIWKPVQKAWTKSVKWLKKLFSNKPRRNFNLRKKHSTVNTLNAAQIAGVVLSNTDDGLRAAALVADTQRDDNKNNEQSKKTAYASVK